MIDKTAYYNLMLFVSCCKAGIEPNKANYLLLFNYYSEFYALPENIEISYDNRKRYPNGYVKGFTKTDKEAFDYAVLSIKYNKLNK